ncbi:alkaline phosphatase D family protein [Pseudomonas fontis]|uniref:Alkaline phosphatase D family protein n=1 Tax=Pseudomonas fontis TaxID=2942633 RepID=A0ABT5NPJ1_9PSED|nr:alkaline phosphatase D family protein [Pseudomonas fontis]MDD0973771.1 alkaline phosphatase D family protein [Pseudomonas fontis]MDD0990073.1 alkaline phosphatase D family protein [Pseudomonas fontis]
MSQLLDPTSNESKYAKLASAAIVGAATPTSVRLWFRVYLPGEWVLVVTSQPLTGDLMRLDELGVADFLKAQKIKPVFSQARVFSYDSDLTGVFDVTGLKPQTSYYYALISAQTDRAIIRRRTEIGGDTPKLFMTPASNPESLTFGFYSCHDPISADGSAGAWPLLHQQLQDQRAQFVIGGGDQVYVDTNRKNGFLDIWEWLKTNKQALLDKYRRGNGSYDKAGIELYLLNLYRWFYRVYWNVPTQREVYERFPQYMIWDDHEIMDGWGSLTLKERQSRISLLFESAATPTNTMLVDLMWRAACRAYYEYEHSHNPTTHIDLNDPDACIWDYAFEQGGSAFYVLDMRGQHDIEKPGDPFLILGSAQMQRFEQWLASPAVQQAKAVFIVSPVPVVHWRSAVSNYADIGSLKDDCMDGWEHDTNLKERRALLDRVYTALGKRGVVVTFLSGDVHSAGVFRLLHKDYPAAKVFQVTSSAVSRMPAPEALKVAISPGGEMSGMPKVHYERWYAMAGWKNFALLCVRPSLDGTQTEVLVELHWPNGDDGEVTKRRVLLK